MENWKIQFESELQQAQHAREMGNEGKARVCARRAAGIAAEEYFKRFGLSSPGPSIQERLGYLAVQPGLPEQTKELINHLLIRVNQDYSLPVDADLISDTRNLARILFLE